jgi:DNA processing protein
MSSEPAALVTLLRLGARPWSEYVELIEDVGSAQSVLAEEQQSTLFGPDTAAAQADLEAWHARGFRLLTILDADYPQNLQGVYDRPPFLFVTGELKPIDSKAIAVIGGRKPTRSGLQKAMTISAELVEAGFTIVSGLAAGIDAAVHEATLRNRGRTIAVIGTGLGRAYPRQNADLQRAIAEGGGAVVSQFWPDSPPSRSSFPLRNATMSGLSLGTVIVEASETSGTRIQARRALQHGRPVFLLESLAAAQTWARELAQAPGTHVVKNAEDVIHRLASDSVLTR